jgi:hypothetical protein
VALAYDTYTNSSNDTGVLRARLTQPQIYVSARAGGRLQ